MLKWSKTKEKHENINWISNRLLRNTSFIFPSLLFIFMNSCLGALVIWPTVACKWPSLLIKIANLKCKFSTKLTPLSPPLFIRHLTCEIWSNKHTTYKTYISDYLHYWLGTLTWSCEDLFNANNSNDKHCKVVNTGLISTTWTEWFALPSSEKPKWFYVKNVKDVTQIMM